MGDKKVTSLCGHSVNIFFAYLFVIFGLSVLFRFLYNVIINEKLYNESPLLYFVIIFVILLVCYCYYKLVFYKLYEDKFTNKLSDEYKNILENGNSDDTEDKNKNKNKNNLEKNILDDSNNKNLENKNNL
jgi:glucan phosphoethanolaminetransferase (alkaline phosphatase superfamily)